MTDIFVTLMVVNVGCMIFYETCGYFYRKLKRRVHIKKQMKRYEYKAEISKEEYDRNGRIF